MARAEPDDSVAFLKVLKKGVRDVIGNKDSTPGERAWPRSMPGVKIAMVSSQDFPGADEDSFLQMTETVRQLFTDVRLAAGATTGGSYQRGISSRPPRTVAAICATRALLMIAVLTGAAISLEGFTVWDPTPQPRLYAAVAFSIVFS